MNELSRRSVLLGVLGAAGVAAVGCSSPPPPATYAPPTSETPTPSPTADTRPRWPLNGKLLKDEDAAKHPAIAVKVPDNQNEHPQLGLDKADIVFVELDGYRDPSGFSATRLVPVFHSKMPDGVGPVRSIRPVDIPALSPMHAVIGNTGATGWVENYVKTFDKYLISDLSYMATKGTGAYSIDRSRVRVWQGNTYYDRAVVCHPKVLGKLAKRFQDGPPQVYFPFADEDEASTADGKKATSISVPWKSGNSYNMSYKYDADSGTYKRSMPWGPHVLTGGKRVAPDNVLVIRARQHYAKIFEGVGHDEPIHDILKSKGTFLYFHGGRYVTGNWTKGEANELFKLTLADGEPLKMAPGQTYVELANLNAKVTIKG